MNLHHKSLIFNWIKMIRLEQGTSCLTIFPYYQHHETKENSLHRHVLGQTCVILYRTPTLKELHCTSTECYKALSVSLEGYTDNMLIT